ncbi:hypothetical protein [Streptomyces spiramenti]|uniref:Uncharacterized protein n=1 Tax=Streptomyces spiramenti TaxID=2720606 RepID=A0ABX1APU3_9ACTN|nr:hypothetical protein [Streptomyces spiramenti]NJP66327.1 hypothetical protein [Streptomyces spiramenti]
MNNRRSNLRVLTTGRKRPRRMPSVPVPLPGESLASWVDAIASRTEPPDDSAA